MATTCAMGSARTAKPTITVSLPFNLGTGPY
jgi:hypothetical protein|eukprot:COSAG01_NODE_1440_length_10297_cov_8.117572_5_plen_31_part_00